MLNLDETLEVSTAYNTQRDLIFRGISYSVSVCVLIEIVRQQLPEINLLQLIPGYYVFLLFITFVFLVSFTDFFLRISFEIENKKSFGTKTSTKLLVFSLTKLSTVFLFLTILLSLTTIIPIGLDSFNSYGEKTLENVWSIDEVVTLEFAFLFLLFLVSQVPTIVISIIDGTNAVVFLRKYWRSISLSAFVISGILTPTIDGYTQLSFSIFALAFYLIIISISIKRSTIPIFGSANLGF